MRKITKLDDSLSNKIAAGEVVERPASVVKELVENSIDGGSKRIQVIIEEAGLASIRIIDDGMGIRKDEVLLAFERHATSKIKNENDLFRIRTLGFRGEALPSIASVSEFVMKTCAEDEIGTLVKLKGGKVVTQESSSCRIGTDITVNNLFFNTPARLKYMKSISTELGHITDVMNRMALSHPEISFSLTHNGRNLLQTSGNGDALAVMAAIYGIDVAKKLIYIEDENLDFTLKGYIALPEINRSSRNYISTIINGRYVKNFSLIKAVTSGYHTLLPIGRYPIVYLQVDMEPLLVDVNVHPSKLEVRFSKEDELQKFIDDAIKKVFKKQTLIPSGVPQKKVEKTKDEQTSLTFTHTLVPADAPKDDLFRSSIVQADTVEIQDRPTFNESRTKFDYGHLNSGLQNDSFVVNPKKVEPIVQETTFHTSEQKEEINENDKNETTYVNKVNIESLSSNASDFAKVNDTFKEVPTINNEKCEVDQDEEEDLLIPPMYPIGQVHGTYIVAQNETGMYLIDQHAAQERIKYEYFKEKVGRVEADLQQLLVPIVVTYSANEALKVEENREQLREVGVFLEPFGINTFIIKEHPTWFPKGQEQLVIESMIQEILTKQKVSVKELREEAAIMMSCKASIKANWFLKENDMFALLETLRKTESPFTCPHGRPIIISFSTYELEKLFKRSM